LIEIEGYYGVGNVGDDALLASICATLASRYEYEAITIPGVQPQYISRLIREWQDIGRQYSTPEHNKTRLLNSITILGGGTRYFDFGETHVTKLRKLLSDPKYYLNRIFGKKAIHPNGCERYALGIGVGPYVVNSKKARAHQTELHNLTGIAVRDSDSRSICQAWGVDSVLGADLCYADPFYSWARLIRKPSEPGKKRVAFVCREWIYPGGSEFNETVKSAILKAEENHVQIDLLIFQQKDRSWIDWASKVGLDCVVWNPEEMHLGDWLAKMATYDLIVSSRYHAGVFCSLLGVKCILLGIDRKLSLLSEQIPSIKNLDIPCSAESIAAAVVDELQKDSVDHNAYVSQLNRLANNMYRRVLG